MLLDQLTAGLRVKAGEDGLDLFEQDSDRPLARIPWYRVADVDPQLVMDSAVEGMALGDADQWRSAFRDGRVRVVTDPASDWVDVIRTDDPSRRIGMARCVAVSGHPYDDTDLPAEERPMPPPELRGDP